MLMWGGGCNSLRYDFFDEASLTKTLASLKKIAGLITQSRSKNLDLYTTVLPAVFLVSVFCWYQICWIFGISVGITETFSFMV